MARRRAEGAEHGTDGGNDEGDGGALEHEAKVCSTVGDRMLTLGKTALVIECCVL
jgi:hypothetical protein